MRFSLYRIVSGVLQFFAWAWLVIGLVLAVLVRVIPIPWEYFSLYGGQYQYDFGLWLNSSLWGAFVVLIIAALAGWASMLTFAGILRLLIAIEGNTFQAHQHPPMGSGYVTAPPPAIYVPPPQPTIQPAGLPCTNCGVLLAPGDKFCQNCGKPTG